MGDKNRNGPIPSAKPPVKDVPDEVRGMLRHRPVHFRRGKFLGKGGFARCYELIDVNSDYICAGKCISKQMLLKKTQRDKVAQEVKIHSELKHDNIVKLEGHFEDSDNVYVLLELCPRRSLMELHKRRRTVTEPEARYFLSQIVSGCEYLHKLKIIHRDLKLGNLFLNNELVVKIGDFGLATKVEFDGQKKQTLCGTPNYIAPEMLTKVGHSYGVDIWAIGCILYTLLCGKPPFETDSLKMTYSRIRNNEYVIPKRIGQHAHDLISSLLAASPDNRPNISKIMEHAFFTDGFMPKALPTSCLVSAPRFIQDAVSGGMVPSGTRVPFGEPLQEMNALRIRSAASTPTESVKQDASMVIATKQKASDVDELPMEEALHKLSVLLAPFNSVDVCRQEQYMETQEQDPASAPIYWITKWVDYSNKYGLSYQLSDDSVGVLFNDDTKIVVDRNGEQVQYTDNDNAEQFYTVETCPATLSKKLTLVRYFRSYMMKHLLTAGANMRKDGDELARLPWLSMWFRTRSAIILMMSDGTLQVNFFDDHTKMIISPTMAAATYINAKRDCATYQLSYLEKEGCTREIQKRLGYAYSMVERMIRRGAVLSGAVHLNESPHHVVV